MSAIHIRMRLRTKFNRHLSANRQIFLRFFKASNFGDIYRCNNSGHKVRFRRKFLRDNFKPITYKTLCFTIESCEF